MSTKYNRIKRLIDLLAEFEETNPGSGLAEFGSWLNCRQVSMELPEEPAKGVSGEVASHMTFYKEMPVQRQFLTLLSRASRFIDFYLKKAFEDISLDSKLEFQFLITIKEMGNPRKTDVIHFNLTEVSTGVEIIKRLKRKGFITEVTDNGDRRIRRVELTESGKNIIVKALEKLEKLDDLAYGFGDIEYWQKFISGLTRFNDYHNELYHEKRNSDLDSLLADIRNMSINF
jgi:DNA-binding MarR family transcriptional regulator